MTVMLCIQLLVSQGLQFLLLKPYQQLKDKMMNEHTLIPNSYLIIYSLEFGPVSGKLRSVSKSLPGDKGPCLPVRSPTGHASWLVGEQDDEAE